MNLHERAWSLVVLLASLTAMGCTLAPDFERSCNGEYIDACQPYEYTQVVTASLEPQRISPGDNLGVATVRATFRNCGERAPAPAALQITAVISRGGTSVPFDVQSDGGATGSGERIVPLGTYRNTSSDPLVFIATIENPFGEVSIPGNADITLRYRSIIGVCEGDGIESAYRTGPAIRR